MSHIIDGKLIASGILKKVATKIEEASAKLHIQPKIVTVLVGSNAASEVYVRAKLRAAKEVGIDAELLRVDQGGNEQDIYKLLKNLNEDPRVTGILVQLPLPRTFDCGAILKLIDYKKDIDAFGIYNTGLLNHWNPIILPCTPQGILYILKKYLGKDLTGKKAVVIGRSIIVGRPMASILMKENCTVTITHSKTVNLKEESAGADILISAAGVPSLVKADWVKEGCFVADVGINRVEGKLVGDVDFENVKSKAAYITPVPGGIGPLTVANLMLNTLTLCYIQNGVRFNNVIDEYI
jgi:methylenetetrahydrofolate dehydrogenase (NADP+)/methenyltetrahydrofolate cyclohydrolase